MTTLTTDLADLVKIEDPAFYDAPHPIFTRMRAERPVFFYEPLDCWVLTKYEDVRLVGSHPEIFSSAQGFLLNDFRYGAISRDLFATRGSEFLSTTDPPRHRELRKMIAPTLTPRKVGSLESSIRANCQALIARIRPGEPIDFINEFAAVLPLLTIAEFFGVPPDSIDSLRFWADEFLKVGAALTRQELEQAAANVGGVAAFFDQWMVRKVGSEASDMLGAMLRRKADGADLSYENLHMFLSSLLTGGIETTRDFLTTSLLALSDYPEQREALRNDPRLAVTATEECLRWVTPVHGFARTVVQDTVIRGVQLHAGQRVQTMWTSANRDEDIWERADEFDISRDPDPRHIAFGFGEHSCVGASVARLQGRVFFEEISRAFSNWELAGVPIRPPSVMHNSYDYCPLAFFV